MAYAQKQSSKAPFESAGRGIAAALFPDLHTARDAVRELKAAGFTDHDIGLALRNPTEAAEPPIVTGTRAAEEAASGAVGGSLLGGLAGLLVAAGVVAIPGLGPLLAGGALASLLGVTGASVAAGAGLGAAAGGLVGALVGLDIPESEARHFEEAIRSGHVLVLVKTPGRIPEANTILERNGGKTDVGGQASTGQPGTVLL